MARATYGPAPQKRSKRLLEALITFANDEFDDCDYLRKNIDFGWQEDGYELLIETRTRFLVELTAKDGHDGKLNSGNIKETLKCFRDFLEISEDNRTKSQGADLWKFRLNLWYPRYNLAENLDRFDQEWQARRSDKSKQATAAAEAGAQRSQTVSKTATQVKQDSIPETHQDWGQAIDVSTFYGRITELDTLQQWVVADGCRLVALLGMGGIGKTALSVKIAQRYQGEFEYLVWRSLRNAPPIIDWLADVIAILSNHQETQLADSLDGRLLQLMGYLKQHRCLLILDNMESILSAATPEQQRSGAYRQGYEGYGQLLRDVGETVHQSCLVLTSREKPRGISLREGQTGKVRSLLLKGLDQGDSGSVLETKGITLSAEQVDQLVQRYGGNPLALQIVATTVQEVFDGNITQFLEQGSSIFGDISDLLEQQLERLSDLEQQVMHWLAIYRDWTPMTELQEDLVPGVPQRSVLEALESLQRRSLIEKNGGLFTQQPVVMEYMTEQLVDGFSQGVLTRGDVYSLNRYALTQAQAHDYLRQAQIQLILQPILERLRLRLGQDKRIAKLLKSLLHSLHSDDALLMESGYAAGNLLKLLHHLGADLTGLDCSDLPIWQVSLQDMTLHGVNFTGADFRKTVFAQIAKRFMSAVFSPDGQHLATGVDEEIRLWQVENRQQVMTYTGHSGWVNTLVFSPDGKMLASGSGQDQTVRLWTVATGQCWKTLRGHTGGVESVAFHPQEALVVSGGTDGQICFWQPETGELIKTFSAHDKRIFSVAFTADGEFLVSSSEDGTVQRWRWKTEECSGTIETTVNWSLACGLSHDGQWVVTGSDGHQVLIWHWAEPENPERLEFEGLVRTAAFSPDDQQIVTVSDNDNSIRLWDVATGSCVSTLQGHGNQVWLARFSRDSELLVSCSEDQTLKLWKINKGYCVGTLKTYSAAIMAVAFGPNGETLVSGSEDGVVRLWDKSTGKVKKTMTGHRDVVSTVQVSTDGSQIASGSDDGTVRLWDRVTGKCVRTFWGHEGWVHRVVFDLADRYLVSSGQDQTIRLWDMASGECVKTLVGHGGRVKALAFVGEFLASGSDDKTIRLWNMDSGESVTMVEGHRGGVLCLAYENGVLASGAADGEIRLWQISLGEEAADLSCWEILTGHSGAVRALVFAESETVISGAADGTVRLWREGCCQQTMMGHDGVVWSTDVRAQGELVSAGADGTMRLWNFAGECLQVMRPLRPYEGMQIGDAEGLTEAQQQTLLALGAVEKSEF
ncbi:MAG: NB-ARC domain-containing protein [Cyanobacteria bacterium P01_D01_bin.56]